MSSSIELWGGIECTVNRVGDRYHDQLEWSGHAHRADDLARIAALGIRRLRYPVLWERVAPNGLAGADWSWTDERLAMLRHLGIEPIVTLAHHGSGIRGATLLDAGYADAFAAYAAAVAERYPWVRDYTPVNEPLTTARFAALYGLWYPHASDDASFARALLAQLRGTVLAMHAIRRTRPDARLIQTEDLGRVRGTRAVRGQVAFENERRWLTWDLLDGRVGPRHALWPFLASAGIAHDELAWFVEHRCPADVIGVNTYVTSDRFLDHRVDRYPRETHGGNGAAQYADVEAVRVCADGLTGSRRLLRDAWRRYRMPVAITEAHVGCTREEQLRWLRDAWRAAHAAQRDGANVIAVTAWALLGAFNWHSLVTRDDDHYEPGAFDVRSEPPRETAIANAIRSLAAGETRHHPAAAGPGWWARDTRLSYTAVRSTRRRVESNAVRACARPLAIVGADVACRAAVRELCAGRGIRTVRVKREALERARAWGVLDLTGLGMPLHVRGGPAVARFAMAIGLPVARIHAVPPTIARSRQLHIAPADASIALDRVVHDALDLLIDGESGVWLAGRRGPTQATQVVGDTMYAVAGGP